MDETGAPPSMRHRMRSLLQNLLLMSVAGVLTIVALEGVLRIALPADHDYFVVRPNTHLELHPDPDAVPGVVGPSFYDVDEHGIRGRPMGAPAADEYRILAIGGSTTELLYIDGPKAWPAVLEELLDSTSAREPVWVGNVGRSGQNSRDHVLHVKYLRDQYPGLDAVIILVGVNDLSLALGQIEDYSLPPTITDPVAEADQVRRAFQVAPPPRIRGSSSVPLIQRLALYDLALRARSMGGARINTFLAERAQGELLRRWRENRREHGGIIEDLPDLSAPLVEYRRNLHLIVDLARERNLRIVFVTQPYLWKDDLTPTEASLLWMGGASKLFQVQSGSPYYAPGVLAAGMDQYNQALLEVCRERDAECVDLASRIARDTTMFFDDAHFTDRGSQAVGEALAAYLLARRPFGGVRDGT